MRVYLNRPLVINGDGIIWDACNGDTRNHLELISKGLGNLGEVNCLSRVRIGFLDKGKHRFIFLNPGREEGETVGIFLCKAYGYDAVSPGREDFCLYEAYSAGGRGNSCSQFGVYRVGTIVKCYSYKNRSGEHYWRLTESGWEDLGYDAPTEQDSIQFFE